MARVLITGMSGAGKTTLLHEMARRGHRTLDTDNGGWVLPAGHWDPTRMARLLAEHRDIIVSGTVDTPNTSNHSCEPEPTSSSTGNFQSALSPTSSRPASPTRPDRLALGGDTSASGAAVSAGTYDSDVSRIFGLSVASVYPLYLAKVERKGRTRGELDEVITWLTGFDDLTLRRHLDQETTFSDFFSQAALNENASLITGVVCGVRVENVEDPLMQKIRYLDKLVDELARGKPLTKVLRTAPASP